MVQKYIAFFITLIIGITLFSNACLAEGRGAIASESVGARSSILGEAYIAIADDANALRCNPAGLPLLLQPEFTASHVSIFSLGGYFDYTGDSGSINQDYIGIAIPNKTIPFGVSFLSLGTSMPYANEGGLVLDPRSYNERMLSLSFGKQLRTGSFGISSGVNLNYLSINGGSNSSSFGLDGGILLKTPGILPDFGIALKGLSSETPVKMDFALCFNPIRPLRLVGGVSKVVDSSTLQYSTGIEYLLRWLAPLNISLLAGYKGLGGIEVGSLKSDASNISTGFSVRLGRYKIDYAYEQHSTLNDTHRVTFGYLMDSPEDFHMKASRYAFEEFNDDKAIQEASEVIYLSPRNAEAYHLMALSYERMRQKSKAIAILEKIRRIDKDYYQKNKLDQLIQDIKEQD
jgi:tetratricopeptide (TPR) repeat protein